MFNFSIIRVIMPHVVRISTTLTRLSWPKILINSTKSPLIRGLAVLFDNYLTRFLCGNCPLTLLWSPKVDLELPLISSSAIPNSGLPIKKRPRVRGSGFTEKWLILDCNIENSSIVKAIAFATFRKWGLKLFTLASHNSPICGAASWLLKEEVSVINFLKSCLKALFAPTKFVPLSECTLCRQPWLAKSLANAP